MSSDSRHSTTRTPLVGAQGLCAAESANFPFASVRLLDYPIQSWNLSRDSNPQHP